MNNSIGHKLVRVKSVGSTNEFARELAREGAAHGTVVIADAQTEGRGRLGRMWSSPPGLNLYMSVILMAENMPALASAPGLVPLASGLAVLAATATVTGAIDASLKWPNDILSRGRKLGGILMETSLRGGVKGGHLGDGDERAPEGEPKRRPVILGIGLNINSAPEDFPPDIRETATSLYIETGRRHEPGDVCREVMARLGFFFGLLEAAPGGLLDQYREACATLGQEVRAITDGEEIRGLATGLDSMGRLVVEDASLGSRALSSAEVVHLLRQDASHGDGTPGPC